MGAFVDLTGRTFNRLYVVEKTDRSKTNRIMWLCKCDCGKITKVTTSDLISGNSKSCGCLAKEMTSNRFTKHKLSKTQIYNIWINMIQRCYNPNYIGYINWGGRGIKVCDKWRNDFMAFYNWAVANGYKEEKLSNKKNKWTIERKDVNGDYCPENCCFATNKEQCNNKRNNKMITYNGRTQNLCQWAEELGISRELLSRRIKQLGWSIEKAFNEPVNDKIGAGKGMYFTYNGETLTLTQWCEKLNIGKDTLYGRLVTRKWSVEKAFTTPIRQCNRRNKSEL